MILFLNRGRTFYRKTLWLDFIELEDCRLVECELVYFGFGHMRFNNTIFEGCRWKLVWAAGRGAALAHTLQSNGGVLDDDSNH